MITSMPNSKRASGPPPNRTSAALLGHSAGYYVAWPLVWTAGIVAVFAPQAIARLRRG
jgi:hypothetical protein